MRLKDLEKWSIPSRVIQRWQQRQGELLLPVQSRSVRKGLLGRTPDDNENPPVRMIVSAPTSSGKSFCAEMAAVRALTGRQKTVMLFPLKSLAEQKYELLRQTYGDLGVKCLIVTADHPESDPAFARGDYQIAVAIYEKFDLLLTSQLDALKNIGLVVIDEIQSITEPGRGAVLERLLTKIKASVYSPSLIGLSAVIGDETGSAGVLAQWLDATLVEETVRPVELMRGVAAEGSYRYRLFNNGLDGSEPFDRLQADDKPFDGFVRQVKQAEGSTLVFLKSRQETVDCAFQLAASVNWPEASTALAALEEEEPSFLVRSLRQALRRGVAFHNSDLSPQQRQIVEQSFVDKAVKVLFSTTTLAMGVNLSADTVYLETVKYTSGRYDNRPSLVPVSRAEFDNMTGRAGRLSYNGNGDGNANRPGRAVVLADSEFEREILWQNYIECDRSEPANNIPESMTAQDWLLDFVVSGLISSAEEEALLAPFQARLRNSENDETNPSKLSRALRALQENAFVSVDVTSGEVTPTPIGRAAAVSGLSIQQMNYYFRRLEDGYPETEAGWIALALSAPGWNMPPSMLSRFEQKESFPLKMLYRSFDYLMGEARCLLNGESLRQPLSYRQAASLKALLLLEKWRQLEPVERLEESFQMHLGQIMTLGETTAHQVRSIAALILAAEGESAVTRNLIDLSFTLRFGIPISLSNIHSRFSGILNRSDYLALQEAGIDSLAEFCQLNNGQLEALISVERKRNNIKHKIESLKEELQMQTRTAAVENRTAAMAPPGFTRPESIEIEGTYEKERYLIKINGFPVRLTGKSFKYFIKLAWSRLNRDSGWIYKEDIEIGFNQARYLYRMKGEICSGLNFDWPVIENNRLGYYRLNAEPSKIRINVESLKNHPDFEVRTLIAPQGAETMN